MNRSLHNFSSNGELLSASSNYFRAAAASCLAHSTQTVSTREALVTHHAAQASARLAQKLARFAEKGSPTMLKAHVQYTPDTTPPNPNRLRSLVFAGATSEALVEALTDASQTWANLYHELGERTSAEDAQTLHDNCQALLTNWAKELHRTTAQQQDL